MKLLRNDKQLTAKAAALRRWVPAGFSPPEPRLVKGGYCSDSLGDFLLTPLFQNGICLFMMLG